MKEQQSYTVTQLTAYISNLYETDPFLSRVRVKGEISGITLASSGHLYFDLKDDKNLIKVAFFGFRRHTQLMALNLKNGDNVVVEGAVSIYGPRSYYQIKAANITLDGEGEMYRKFLELKAELEEAGMFDPMYKKPIPKYAHTIGVVTSATGRAIGDIKDALERTNPYIQLVLYPAQVQGDGSVETIVDGIKALEAYGVDFMIVGRGGGSMEDLWSFNAREIAEAIFSCSVPVVSAVGHEDDYLISDYVADFRSPTPSRAVTDNIFNIFEFDESLAESLNLMERAMSKRIRENKETVAAYEERLKLMSPENKLKRQKELLSTLKERLSDRMTQKIERRKHQLNVCAERLDGRSPLRQMQGGYAYVSDTSGHGISEISKISKGDDLVLHMQDGNARVNVMELTPVKRPGA